MLNSNCIMEKNSDFAATCIRYMFSSNKMNSNLIDILTSKDLCNQQINGRYPSAILLELHSPYDLQQEIKVGTNKPRYYKDIFIWNGRQFLISNYWYGPDTNMKDNKTPFVKWINIVI